MNILYIIASGVVYGLMCYSSMSNLIFPVEMLCTFLHEFGHAIFCKLSGGDVESLCVNVDGSGVTTTMGGSGWLITMGGYIGSALFGNTMIFVSANDKRGITLKVLSVLMAFSSLIWFSNMMTTVILLGFSVLLFLLSITPARNLTLAFLGVASIIYIIQDFNVGPTSDLEAYEREVGIFPAQWWMYIWLGIVLAMTAYTFYLILKSKRTYSI